MKYSYFVIFGLFIFTFTSCCGDYGIDSDSNKTRLFYSRKIKLLDTLDKIVKISYKESDKIFYPNDTVSELIISENKENTLYISTKTKIDTIVLLVKVIYSMGSSKCEAINTTKDIEHLPIIISHSFDSAYFKAEITQNAYSDILFIKP